jgi:4-amino-4-deoxy-L-arabinose transferase-like glycosyltransferase
MSEIQGAIGKGQRTERISESTNQRYAIRNTHYALLVIILLVAAAFRLFALNDVPPGLHHDEVIIGQEAKDILSGHLSIYFTGGYGQEPLYHYFTAGLFAFIGANPFGLRLSSAFIALIGLAITYRFTRKLFSPIVAIATLAWMSISLWPIFFSRVGLRGIALPVFTMLAAYFLWRAIEQQVASGKWQVASQFAVAGALLGLSIYTYQASRVFPIIFGIFIIYLFVTRSTLITNHSLRSFIIFFVSALIVAAPLVLYLTKINPSAEQRIGDLSGSLNKLMAGDPSEVIQSTLNTLGMFTIRGDAVPIYNVSDRPVLPEPIGAALFYLGFIICLWRWKKPQYALMLIWFFISLVPAMITPFSPNFVRTIASWPTPFVFAGIGMNEVMQVASRERPAASGQRRDRLVTLSPRHLVVALFAIVFVFNAASTARDYFIEWPTGDYVRFWQQATWTQAVRTLNADPSNETVAASGLSINTFDPQTLDLLKVRSSIKVKWFDCRNAMLFPNGGEPTRYLAPGYLPCDPDVMSWYLRPAQLIMQPRWSDTNKVIFTLLQFDDGLAAVNGTTAYLKSQSVYQGAETFEEANPNSDLQSMALPIDLAGLKFLGRDIDRTITLPGETAMIVTYWQMTAPVSPPLSIFVHMTAPDGKIIAQWDGLDVGIGSLEPYDFFIQWHRIQIPPDAPIGPYRISMGVYRPDTNIRLRATIGDRSIDSIVLGTLTLVK